MASPPVHANPKETLVDPFKVGEYSIFLGESLQGAGGAKRHLLNVRYNWTPKAGGSKHEAVVTRNAQRPDSQFNLLIRNGTGKSYRYAGRVAAKQTSTKLQHEDVESLALIYDPSQAAFILEPISTSLDFNLTSAPDLSRETIEALTQLSRGSPRSDTDAHHADHESTDPRNDPPDSDSPYDYRHFLAEARDNLDRAPANGSRTPIPGSQTPVAGSRTPMSGLSSPVPGASRFLGQPTEKATAASPNVTSAPAPAAAQKRRKPDDKNATATLSRTTKPKPKPKATQAKPKAPAAALSKNIISDSESSDDYTQTRTTTIHVPHQPHKPGVASPHIVVDDPSGLEIDLGSPPPPTRRRHVIDPSAFRSHVGTPAATATAGSTRHVVADDSDVEMEDNDVDELELGSPAAHSEAPSSSRVQQATLSRVHEADTDDDDDELAAELEAALEEEENDEQGVGLGISSTATSAAQRPVQDEESEISEEE